MNNVPKTGAGVISITTNGGYFADRFARYLGRQLQITKLTVEQVIRREAKGVIKAAFKFTPPMAGRSFAKGYSASRKAIKRTVYRALIVKSEESVQRSLARVRSEARREVLTKTLEQLKVDPASLVRFIKHNQKPDKHYPDAAPRHYSTAAKRKQVIELLEKTIGATAAGWCRAALALGITVPDWVTRWQHRNAGSVFFEVKDKVVQFKAINPNKHTDSKSIQRVLDQAFDVQANNIRKQLNSAIAAKIFKREDIYGR